MIKERSESGVCDRISAAGLGPVDVSASPAASCGSRPSSVKLENDLSNGPLLASRGLSTPESGVGPASNPSLHSLDSTGATSVTELDSVCGMGSIKLEPNCLDPMQQPPPPLVSTLDGGKSSTEFGSSGGAALKREDCSLVGGMGSFGGGVRSMVSSDFGLSDTQLVLGGPSSLGAGLGPGGSPSTPVVCGSAGVPGLSPSGNMAPSTQPLPPSTGTINKQPLTADAQYMQQQSHIFVFSTQLANKAFEAVMQSQFPTIIAYHCAQPGTKAYLDKHPLKMSQFSRGGANSAWLNSNGKRPLSGSGRTAVSSMSNSGDTSLAGAPPRVPRQGMCSASFSTASSTSPLSTASCPSSVAAAASCAAVPPSPSDASIGLLEGSGERPLTSVQRLSDEHLTPEQRQHRAEQLATLERIGRMLMPDQLMTNGGGSMPSAAPPGGPGSPMLGPDGAPVDPRMIGPGAAMGPGGGIDPRMMGPNGPMAPGMMEQRINGPGGHMAPGVGMDIRMMGPGVPMDPRMMAPGGSMDGRMMVPGATVDPRMMCPNGQIDPRMMAPGGPVDPRMMTPGGPVDPRMMAPGGPVDPRMIAPGGPIDARMMGPAGVQPRMMGSVGMMPANGPPNSMAAQIEWHRLQSEFYDERRKRGVNMNHSSRMMVPSRMQGPPPPYPQSHIRPTCASGAISSPNTNVGSPTTTSLPKTSPRLLSPAMYPRLPTPGPSPHPVPSPSPRHTSNPGTPVSVPASPAAPVAPAGRVPAPDFTPPQSQPPSGAVPGSMSPAHPPSANTQQLAQSAPGVDMFGNRAPNVNAMYGSQQMVKSEAGANLMPVPSPQQIQYINNFEGQELTIHKQPNTGLRDSDSVPDPACVIDPLTGAADASTSTCSAMMVGGRAGPPTPLTPSAPPLTPGADRFPVPSPQQLGPNMMEPTKQLSPRYPGPMVSAECGAGRFSSPGGVMRMPCSSGGQLMMPRASLPSDPADVPLSHVPLNPQQSPLPVNDRAFDPISSMVQMSQQLTGGPGSATGASSPAGAGFMSSSGLDQVPVSTSSPRVMAPGPPLSPGPSATGSPKPTMVPGVPQPTQQFGGGGMPRMMTPGMVRPNGASVQYGPGGANVQVKPGAPNTIQYLPTRPQTSSAGARGPPSLEFLQRFTAPSSMAGPVPGGQPTVAASATGEPIPGSTAGMAPGMPGCPMGGPGMPMGMPMGASGPMNPSGPIPMTGPGGPMMAGPGNFIGPDSRHPGSHMTRPMNVVMGPNGPMMAGPMQPAGYSHHLAMGPGGAGGPMIMSGGAMPVHMGPRGPMMRQNSNPAMTMGIGEPVYGPGGGPAMMPNGPSAGAIFSPKSGHMSMMGGAPDAAQPLPPSMGQPGVVKQQGQYGAAPGAPAASWYH